MATIYLIAAFLLNGTANILLKIGSKKGIVFDGVSLQTITANYLFILGLICFALNALFYFLALKALPLTVAYPVMIGMSLIIINAFALIYLNESINFMQMIGYGLLVIGVGFIFYFSSAR